MFDGGGNDVTAIAAGGQPENREVVALGCAAREDHIAAAAADDGGDAIASLFDGRARAASPVVSTTAGIAELLVHVAQHLGAHARIERR